MNTETPFTIRHFESFDRSDKNILIVPDLTQSSKEHELCINDFRTHASVYWLDYNIQIINNLIHWPFTTETIKQYMEELMVIKLQTPFDLCIAQGLGASFIVKSDSLNSVVVCNPSMKDSSIGILKILSAVGRFLAPNHRGMVQTLIENHWRDQYGLPDYEAAMPWLDFSPTSTSALNNATWHLVLSLIHKSTLGLHWLPSGILLGGDAPSTVHSLNTIPCHSDLQYKVYPKLRTNLLLASKVRQDIKQYYLEF